MRGFLSSFLKSKPAQQYVSSLIPKMPIKFRMKVLKHSIHMVWTNGLREVIAVTLTIDDLNFIYYLIKLIDPLNMH